MNYEGQLFAKRHRRSSTSERDATHAHLRRTTKTMQKIQAHDDETLESGSSAASLNALDNETDTFGREIMQYERDARRLRNTTRGDSQPLVKTRPRPRISELVARREREDEAASAQQRIRTASSGSNDSNPPLDVPREWGTRAKSHRGWMRKIREPSGAGIDAPKESSGGGLLTPEEDGPKPHKGSYTGDNIWDREDEHVISTENTPPSMRRARPRHHPTNLRDANATLRHIIDSEDQDFGELSLLASTPATTKFSERNNDKARHDVKQTEAHHVADRPRISLSDRSPNRTARHAQRHETSSTFDDKRIFPSENDQPRPATSSYAGSRADRRSALTGNKENVPVNNTREAHIRTGETATINERTAQAVTFKQHQRPSHTRNGSLHLLQRLATSLSPSPGKSSSEAVHSGNDRARSREHKSDPQDRATGIEDPKPDQATRRRPWRKYSTPPEEVNRFVPGDHGWYGHAASGERTDVDGASTSNGQHVGQTPIVTGAWVDTPAQPKGKPENNAGQNQNGSNSKSDNSSRAPFQDSNRPRSALEEIVRDARKQQNGLFGDATLQSLEDIVHPNVDATDTTLTLNEEGAENRNDGRPLTQAEEDQRQEDLALEALNKHLRAARTSIKDADRGLKRVENQWDSTSRPNASDPAPATSRSKQGVKLDRDGRTVCDHCGGSYHSIWWGLWTELRSTFYVYDKSTRFGIRATWPGILLLACIAWYILENLLCYRYCHPMYAEFMVGFGVNPDAPEYPFVIPTLLFRPLRPVWKPCVEWLKAQSTELSYNIYGRPPKPAYETITNARNWDAFLASQASGGIAQAWKPSWTERATATAAAAASRVTRSFVDAVDEWGGDTMNDDEYL